jgi:hypothetical protein
MIARIIGAVGGQDHELRRIDAAKDDLRPASHRR